MNEQKLLNTIEATKYLKISRMKLNEFIKKYNVPVIKISPKDFRYDITDLNNLIETLKKE